MIEAKFYVGGHFIDGERKLDVLNKYSNEPVGTYPLADDDLTMMAISSACEASPAMEALLLESIPIKGTIRMRFDGQKRPVRKC